LSSPASRSHVKKTTSNVASSQGLQLESAQLSKPQILQVMMLIV